jgi:minor histocompatibility antigen H13
MALERVLAKLQPLLEKLYAVPQHLQAFPSKLQALPERIASSYAPSPVPPPLILTYAALIVMAVVPIIVGSFLSLGKKDNAPEKMTSESAAMFPLVGSCFLFGLYILFTVVGKEYVNWLLSSYFLFFGIVSLESCLSPIVLHFWPSRLTKRQQTEFEFSVHVPFIEEPFEFQFGRHNLVSLGLSSAFAILYVTTKHWLANNVLGLAFSVQAITMVPLGSWQIGCILLVGLFFYDIFWVFATDVMVTVAKNFDAPIKVLFPRDIFAETFQFSMLGLGDIVMPGFFLALLLRLDRKVNPKTKLYPYFTVGIVSYLLGLLTTMGVMHVFKAAQPALLYLVPFCVGGSLLTALVRGELGTLISFEDKEETPVKAGAATPAGKAGAAKKAKKGN